jgi:alpha-beta hydrolase superfamily lysophospholipase
VVRAAGSRGRAGLFGGAVAAGSVLMAGAVFAGAVTTGVARRISAPGRGTAALTSVLAVDEARGWIRFDATDDAALPGRYSFWFDGGHGHARVGRVLERAPGSVTRELLGVDAGALRAGQQGRFNGWVYLSPASLDVPYDDVRVQTTLGWVPAWEVPAEGFDSQRWAVLVHGRATVRQEVLRAVPVFRAAGYSTLLVSYRDDGEAPPSAAPRYGLEDAEWLDVESAILHVLDQGAREVVLMGWSMGGAIVLQTATRSRLASVLTGIVLESPVLSWAEALLHQGDALDLPAAVKRGALTLVSSRLGARLTGHDEPIDLRQLELVAHVEDLPVPVLILHSEDDGFAPLESSRRLARERPDLVQLVPFRTARHTKLWNYDPERWEGAIAAWLRGNAEDLAALGTAVSDATGGRQRRRRSQRA